MDSNFKIPPLYLEVGKQLALSLAESYSNINPLVGLGVVAAKAIIDAQASVTQMQNVLVQAQQEGWSETDTRWDAPLALQQKRMQAEDDRHDTLKRE